MAKENCDSEVDRLQLKIFSLTDDRFQHALPQLIFENVFQYLSPGYL